MGRGTLEDLQTMLGESGCLDPEVIETARICMESVLTAAVDYEPNKEKPTRMTTGEIARELKVIRNMIKRTLHNIEHLSDEAFWHLDLAMLPKAELDIEDWGEKKRHILKSWLEPDALKFQELGLVADYLGELAKHVAKRKQSPSGPRSRSRWSPEPADILLFSIAQAIQDSKRDLQHAKPIADTVHQWATEDDPSNCLSLRAWGRVQKCLQEKPKSISPEHTQKSPK